MSLWHTDWYQVKDDRWKGKWLLIAYLDDASRFDVGYGVFDESTTYNVLSVLDDCIARYGKPLEILTDHGSQFYANSGEIKGSRNKYIPALPSCKKDQPYTWKSTSSSNKW